MRYNILIGGAAGQGMDTAASILEKIFKRMGLEVFSTRDYMSRIRGGHNFIQIRFGDELITSHTDELHGIIALDSGTVDIHRERLSKDGFVICDATIYSEDSNNIKDNRIIRLDMVSIAKELGNSKVFGSVAIGAVLKLYGMQLDGVREVFEDLIKTDLVEVNQKAVIKGYESISSKFSINSKPDVDRYLINGNEAIALGALAAGVKFYSAYPMTPSTSIMNYIASKMREMKVVVEQAEDEIAGINMAIGASYAGARAMTGTSGGGFCLKVEAIGLAAMLEVPLVIANIQRPGPVTGFPTRTEQGDLKFVINSSHGEFPRMVIAPRNVEDAFYQTARAFNIADKYQIPVIILGDQFLADSVTTVKAFDFDKVTIERHLADPSQYKDKEYKRYELSDQPISDRLIPGKTFGSVVCVDSDEHDEYGNITELADIRVKMNDRRLNKLNLLKEDLQEPEFIGNEDFDVLLVGWGSMFGPLREAIHELNKSSTKYSALVFGDVFPLPEKLLNEKVKKAKEIINVEQNATGQLASIIREHTGIKFDRSILKYDGRQISSAEIVSRLESSKENDARLKGGENL